MTFSVHGFAPRMTRVARNSCCVGAGSSAATRALRRRVVNSWKCSSSGLPSAVKSAERAVVDQPAFVDEQHAAGHRLDFLQDVGREQDRLALAQLADRLADLANLVRVEPGGRLVEDQHVGLVQQHLGHADALPIAPGELADRLADHAAQAHRARRRPRSARACARRSARGRRRRTPAASAASCRGTAGRFRADSPAGRSRPAGRSPCRGRRSGPRRPRGPGSRSAASWSCSCRPRWGRGRRRLRPGGS